MDAFERFVSQHKANTAKPASSVQNTSAKSDPFVDFVINQRTLTDRRNNRNAAVDADYVNQYLSDYSDFYGGYMGNTDGYSGRYDNAMDNFAWRGQKIRDWLDFNQGSLDPEYYAWATGMMNNIDIYTGQMGVEKGFRDYTDWYNSSLKGLEGMDWATGVNAGGMLTDDIQGYNDRAAASRQWLDANREFLGEDYYQYAVGNLDSMAGYNEDLAGYYTGQQDFFRQWDNAEDYERWVYLKDLDTDAMAQDIADMEKRITDLQNSTGGGVLRRMALHGAGLYSAEDVLTANREIEDAEAQLLQMRSDLKEATLLQQGIQEDEWAQEYAGMSYDQIMPILYGMEDGAEKEWLSQYAPSTMTTQDMTEKKAENNTRLYHLNGLVESYDQLMASVTYDVWGRVTADSISQAEALLKENGFSNIQDVKAEIEALTAENWELDNRAQYEGLPGQSDFAAMSTVPEGYTISGGAVSKFDFINNINNARERETVGMAMNGGESPYAAYAYMDDSEIAIYNYLYNTEGSEAADEYLEYIQYDLNARKMADVKGAANWIGQEGGIAASLLSVPANLMGIAGIADVGVQHLARGLSGEYKPIDYNRTAMTGHAVGQGIRKAKAEKYNAMGTIQLDPEKNPVLARILNGRGWGDVYQLGMSMLDSWATAGLNRIGLGSAATALLSGSAATQGVLDAVERGASDQQALTMGILNGMAEWFFEKYELDQLLGRDTTYVKAMLNQGATEAFGEGATSIANTLTDVIVMAGNSEFADKVDEYMLMGYSREEATMEAFTDTLIEIGWDAAGGFLMGGLMGGGQQAITNMTMAPEVRANSRRLQELGASRYEADQAAMELSERGSKYGAQGKYFAENYLPEQNVEEYDLEFQTAYELGKAGGSREALGKVTTFRVMRASQQDIAYSAGVEARKKAVDIKTEKPEATFRASESGHTLRNDTGAEIEIKGFAKVGDQPQLDIGGGKTIEAEKVSYGSAEEAVLYETIGKVAGSANTANGMLKAFREAEGISAADFADGLWEAYEAGRTQSATKADLRDAEFAKLLPVGVRSVAYDRGAARGRGQADTQEAMIKAKGYQRKGQRKEGQLHFDRKGRTFDEAKERALGAMEAMAKALGLQIYVYESFVSDGKRVYVDANGKTVKAPNGFYDPEDSSIHIDLNAGNLGQGTMLFTLSHELTHYIREWSQVRFRILADTLLAAYEKDGLSVSALVERQMLKAKENGREMNPEEALEEVVADSMESMLADGSFGEVLAKIQSRDKTLWQKIRDWFRDVAEKLKAAADDYRGYAPDSTEGKLVRQMDEMYAELQKLFAEGLVEASGNYAAAEGQKNTTREGGKFYEMAIKRSERIVDQIKNSLSNIMALDNVYTIDQTNAVNYSGNRKTDENTGHKVFLGQGGIAYRPNYGKVILGKKSAINTVFHGNGPAKQAAFPAVKAVIEKGIEIYRDNNHEGRGYDTVTFAAPISFFGNKAPMATVVREFENGRGDKSFYIHEICDSEGNYIQLGIDEEQKISSTGGVELTSTAGAAVGDILSDINVTQPKPGVNPESLEAMDLEVDEKTESVAPSLIFSERTWTQSEYVQERDMAALAISKAIGVSIQKAKDYIDSVNSIAKMIADDRTRLDYFSSPGRSSFIGNVEYGGSFDFSTLCKKRRLLTGTFTAIQKALPNTALTANEILEIRKRMQDAGLEVSCGLCYVEGSRANMGQFAKEFLRLYKQYYPDGWQPNMADVNTPEGIEWVRINHPEVYEQYEYFWNHYGTLKPGDKNLFASQQKPKLYQLHTEYKGEILQKFRNDDNVEDKNINGGIRLQSFSDFEIVHLIDTMQIIMDMSRVGLAGQAYTKVPDFAWALGDTGLKINLSLIAKGVDDNGQLIFDDVEGMPIQEAMRLRERYSENVGTILVAFNDAQLKAAMADPRVDFIIPFHRSQWKKSQYEAMGLPKNTKDYTYMQNEKYIKPQYHEYRGRMVRDKATNYMPNEYWDFSKSGTENARAYLEMCARNNKRPKFYKLLTDNKDGSYSLKEDGSTDGYWKLLIDFKMYDNQGNGSPQRPVTPEFNMEEANRMLNDYRGGHSSFPVAQGIADQFVAEYKESHKGKVLSDRDPTAAATMAELEKQNAALRGDVEELKKLLALQGQVTGGRIPKKSSVDAAGRWLKKYAGATMESEDMKTLSGMLMEFYTFLSNDDEYSWEDVMERAAPIADYLQARVNVKPQISEYARDVLRELKERKIKLSDSQKAEVTKAYGSYNEYRKAAFGSVTLSSDGMSLDSVWNEMAKLFPGTFDEEVTAGDQPMALLDVIQGLRSTDQSAMEYAYNREFIRADLIWAVYDSFWRVKNIETVADRNAKEVNAIKAKHRQQMETLRQEKNKAIQRVKKQRADDIEKVRQEMRQEIRDRVTATEKRYQESRTRATEKRRQTAAKGRLKKLVQEISNLYENGTKERNVKKGMRGFVEQALAAATVLWTDNYTDEDIVLAGVGMKMERWEQQLLEKTQELIRQRNDVFKGGRAEMEAEAMESGDTEGLDALTEQYEKLNEQIRKNMRRLQRVLRFERQRLNETTITAMLEGLAQAYKELGSSDDNFIRAGTYENVYQGLKDLIEDVRGTTVQDMTSDQLDAVERAYRMVLHTIRDANKSFTNEKAGTIAEQGQAAAEEIKAVGGFHEDRVGAADPIRKFWWNNLKPVYVFERIGSKTLKDAFNAIRKGEDVWAVDVNEARDFFRKAAERYGYDSWDMETAYTFKTPAGKEFKLTLGQMMSIYAYSKRQNAKDHLRIGGVVFDPNQEVYREGGKKGKLKRIINDATAYQIGEETVAQILGQMDADQIGFVDEMQEYLSETMGAKGNEVSTKLYGIDLFGEKNYFPMKSARQFLFEQNQPAGEVSLKNSGFTKAIQPGANNPLILGSFMDVWSQHVNQMSTYHGFALPIEDFNRIFNYQTPRNLEMTSRSVKAALQGAYTPAAVEYISQMLRDVNGGARMDPAAGIMNKMMSLFKKGAVFASLSVVIQQPSAIGRAAALIDPKYFSGKKVSKQNIEESWEEAKKYAPVALIKEMGFFDTGVGRSTQDYIMAKEYLGLKEQAKALAMDSDFRDEMLGMAPALADNITWAGIWNAVKREQKDLHKDMDVTSEEFLKICGERYTEVITKTQVYDSVLSRSANMRSKDTGMKMATAFMAEPTTSINMITDAIIQARRGVKGYPARAIGAVVAAQILNSILVSFVYAARDDDKERTYWEKYLKSLADNIWNDVFLMVPNSIPFIADVMSMLKGYDVERADMSVISDFIAAIRKLEDKKRSPWEKIETFSGAMAQIFGFPLKNIIRDLKGLNNVLNHVQSNVTRELYGLEWNPVLGRIEKTYHDRPVGTAAGAGYAILEGLTGEKTSKAQQLYDATVRGDRQHIARMEGMYSGKESTDAAIRSVIKELYMSGEIDREEAEKQLFNYAGMEVYEAWWTVDAWVYEKDKGYSDGYSKYDDIYEAMLEGGDITELMAEFTDHGYKEEDVLSSLKTQIGRWYYDDESETRITREQAEDMLVQYMGMKGDDLEDQMRKWDMKLETGFSYTELKGEFLERNVTKEDAIIMLKKYGGLTNAEAEEKVEDWVFERQYGFAYSDMRELYLDDELSEYDARIHLRHEGGKDDEDIEYTIRLWNFEKEHGWAYEDRVSLYKRGDLSGADLQKVLIDFGGYSVQDARTQVEVYNWELDGLDNVTISRVKKWHEYCEPLGIGRETFLDVQRFSYNTKNDIDPDTGKAISYSAMKKVMAYIDSLPLTAQQKDAMAYSLGWSKKNIEKYKPW